MKATLLKTHYFSLRESFKQHNDYKWAKIVFLSDLSFSNLSRDALLFVT